MQVNKSASSLRAAALVLWRRSNLRVVEGDCFGQEQERPRNDVCFLVEGRSPRRHRTL